MVSFIRLKQRINYDLPHPEVELMRVTLFVLISKLIFFNAPFRHLTINSNLLSEEYLDSPIHQS